jgi:uridine kinase
MIDQKIIEYISHLPKPAIIAISGFGGAGKSTIAKELGSIISSPVISVDSFWKNNLDDIYSLWNIVDIERLKDEVLNPFSTGVFHFTYNDLSWGKNEEHQISAGGGFLIIEGVGILRPECMDYFACSIWIDCPLDEAVIRGKKRDREEYNHPQDEKWEGIWKTNDKDFFETFRPDNLATFIITNPTNNNAEI